jgi:hypothetical protein
MKEIELRLEIIFIIKIEMYKHIKYNFQNNFINIKKNP